MCTFLTENFKTLLIFCGCTARFMSGLARKPEDRFSYGIAHHVSLYMTNQTISLPPLFLPLPQCLCMKPTISVSGQVRHKSDLERRGIVLSV